MSVIEPLLYLCAMGILATACWIVVLAVFAKTPTKRSTSSKLPANAPRSGTQDNAL